jgi:hypothetical protein
MKTFIPTFIFLLYICSAFEIPAFAHPAPKMASATMSSKARPRVAYSFDHLAGNKKVTRLFISDEMLSAANASLVKSDRWEFSHIVDRLTSVLTMHTHSTSTTARIRQDFEKVSQMKDYELLMQLNSENVEIIVFGVRGRGRELNELLIFRFRDSYCSRVVQLTGKLTTDDIGNIIKLNKKL